MVVCGRMIQAWKSISLDFQLRMVGTKLSIDEKLRDLPMELLKNKRSVCWC